MSDDWAERPTDFADLETKASALYDQAVELARCEENASGIAKMYDVALKALRLQAELREKTAKPRRIERLKEALDATREAIAQHHAGTDDRTRKQDDGGGKPPAWRIQ